MTKTQTRAILENAGGTTEKSANSGVCGKIFVLPFYEPRKSKHRVIRARHMPNDIILKTYYSGIGRLDKKTPPSKDRSVISGNPDLNPPKIEEPLKMERASGPFRLIDKTARGLACKAAFRKKNKPSFESLLS